MPVLGKVEKGVLSLVDLPWFFSVAWGSVALPQKGMLGIVLTHNF